MLIIDQLMNLCVYCLSYLAVYGSTYTSESGLWKIDEAKRSSHISGNWSGEHFFITYQPTISNVIRILFLE